MSKPLSVNENLIKSYLSDLLTEDEIISTYVQSQTKTIKNSDRLSLEKLLSKQPLPPIAASTNDNVVNKVTSTTINQSKKNNVTLATEQKENNALLKTWQKEYKDGDFQAIFFQVAGLTIAVPLTALGGIFNLQKTTPIVGKPDWFIGVMSSQKQTLNIVDTAKWIMPEKCDEYLLEKLDYKYTLKLSDSDWGLTVEKLFKTETLKQSDIKWSPSSSQRPWLAGLVKKRMCVLLDVNALIKMLQKGHGVVVK